MNATFWHRLTPALAMLIVTATAGRPALSDEPAGQPASRHSETWTEDPLSLTIRMRVSPAAEARPALKHRFLVPPVEQVHANAATFYYKALAVQELGWRSRAGGEDRMIAWLEMPTEALPVAEIKNDFGLVRSDEFKAALRDGARADDCDWGDPIRELGVKTPLDAAQHMRSVARALALLARLEIAEHRHADAIETLRLSYAMSRHLGHSTTIVQTLIGLAVEGITDETARRLIADPDSPNLYWALTELASRPIEVRGGLSYETHFWEFTAHDLVELEKRTLTPDESLGIVRKLWEFQVTENFRQGRGPWGAAHELALSSSALWIEPQARAYLLEHGHTAAGIDAMPLVQRALLYRWRQFVELRDDYFKWTLLPDDEVEQRLARLHAEEASTAGGDVGAVFLEALPAAFNSLSVGLRKKRENNLLRTVEALRMYAAHEGHWPTALADVTAVPVPLDPVTGNRFEYSVSGDVAILSAPAHRFFATRYELTLSKPKSTK